MSWMARSAVAVCGFCLASAAARAQTTQSWNEIDLVGSWKSVGLTVPIVARLDSHLPNPQLLALGLTADLPLPWQLTLTGGYLFVDLPQRTTPDVHVPLVALTKTVHVRGLTIADRNRVEKLVGLGASPVRYRNRLLANFQVGANGRWHAFIDDETFYDFTASHWTQNRFQFGGGARLFTGVAFDLYFLQRSQRGGVPATNVVGATLRMTLNGKARGAT